MKELADTQHLLHRLPPPQFLAYMLNNGVKYNLNVNYNFKSFMIFSIYSKYLADYLPAGSAMTGSAQASSAQANSAKAGSAQAGSAKASSVQAGSAQAGSAPANSCKDKSHI